MEGLDGAYGTGAARHQATNQASRDALFSAPSILFSGYAEYKLDY